MIIRRALAGVLVALTLVACSSSPVETPNPTTSPDTVAAAFASAFAAGDTPQACTYTAGRARLLMTDNGLCTSSQWGPQGHWATQNCAYPPSITDLAQFLYTYKTNGQVQGGESFAVGVTGSGSSWHVTFAAAGTADSVARLCSKSIVGTTS